MESDKIIYKYELKLEDSQYVVLKKGSKILTAQYQNGVMCIWALINTKEVKEVAVRVYIFGTGNSIANNDLIDVRYLSTVQSKYYVWHVFVDKDC